MLLILHSSSIAIFSLLGKGENTAPVGITNRHRRLFGFISMGCPNEAFRPRMHEKHRYVFSFALFPSKMWPPQKTLLLFSRPRRHTVRNNSRSQFCATFIYDDGCPPFVVFFPVYYFPFASVPVVFCWGCGLAYDPFTASFLFRRVHDTDVIMTWKKRSPNLRPRLERPPQSTIYGTGPTTTDRNRQHGTRVPWIVRRLQARGDVYAKTRTDNRSKPFGTVSQGQRVTYSVSQIAFVCARVRVPRTSEETERCSSQSETDRLNQLCTSPSMWAASSTGFVGYIKTQTKCKCRRPACLRPVCV